MSLDDAATATQSDYRRRQIGPRRRHLPVPWRPDRDAFADAAFINEKTDAVGFVGASSLERMAVEESLTNLTKEFKSIPGEAGLA